MISNIIQIRNRMSASAAKQSDVYHSMLMQCQEKNIPLYIVVETDTYGTTYLELDFIIVPEEPELHPEEIKYFYHGSALKMPPGYTVQEAYDELIKICEEKAWSLAEGSTHS